MKFQLVVENSFVCRKCAGAFTSNQRARQFCSQACYHESNRRTPNARLLRTIRLKQEKERLRWVVLAAAGIDRSLAEICRHFGVTGEGLRLRAMVEYHSSLVRPKV